VGLYGRISEDVATFGGKKMKMHIILVLDVSMFRFSLTVRVLDATKIFVGFYQTTRRYLPGAVHNDCLENSKSIYILLYWPIFLFVPS